MIKSFLKWYHKRKAHSHDLSMLSYLLEEDNKYKHNKHWRLLHEKWRDYHLKEMEKLNEI